MTRPASWTQDRALAGTLIAAPADMWYDLYETQLPRFEIDAAGRARLPVDRRQAWRIRAVGTGYGSRWNDVAAAATTTRITAEPVALDLRVTMAAAGSPRLAMAGATIFLAGNPRGPFRTYDGAAADGVLEILGLPAALRLNATFAAEGYLPRTLTSTVERFPARIELEPACELDGTVTDAAGQPLAGAEVRGEGFSDDGLLVVKAAATDPAGRYSLALPRAPVAILLTAPGHERKIERHDLSSCPASHSAGRSPLERAASVHIRVLDEVENSPIGGAEIRTKSGFVATTDRSGMAVLEGVAPGHVLEATTKAPGYLAQETHAAPPRPPLVTIKLGRAGELRGTLVSGGGGGPVAAANLEVNDGQRLKPHAADSAGAFSIEVTPNRSLIVTASSPAHLPREMRIEPVPAGETRDLGEIALEAGFEVVGRLVDAEGAPLAGGRIWATRGSDVQQVVAWARGQVVDTTSAADGGFRLSGLPLKATSVRFEVEGRAPAERRATPPAEGGERVDLGDIALPAGGTLLVHADPTLDGVARADWRGQWREPDLITAPLVAGEAAIDNVPAGESRVSVLVEGEVVCEVPVRLTEGEALDVDCDDQRLEVIGRVLVGGRPAGPGSLSWSSDAGSDTMILESPSSLGVAHHELFGLGRPPVQVTVVDDGSFASNRLAAGRWTVLWLREGSRGSQQRDVSLPAAGPVQLDLEFPGGTITGSVRDGDGQPVADARVVDMESGSTARSGAEGEFLLDALPEGRALIRATKGEQSSGSIAVEVGPEPSEPIELVLAEPERFVLTVLADQEPAPNALVFLESAGAGVRLLVTDERGTIEADSHLAPAFRAASWSNGRWGLGDWVQADAIAAGYTVHIGAAGALRIASGGQSHGELDIEGPGGWRLGPFLRQVGQRLRLEADGEVVVIGLAPGSYRVQLGSTMLPVVIIGDEEAAVELP